MPKKRDHEASGSPAHERERGNIYFAYRPKVDTPVVHGLDDVQRFCYVVVVKNPKAETPPGVGLDEADRAPLPKPLQNRFRGRRFIPLDPTDFLNHEGVEILLVGAKQAMPDELGVTLDPERETEGTADVFTDLRMEKSLHPVEPLFEGKWV